jgi:D-amino-acid dehydrogenase
VKVAVVGGGVVGAACGYELARAGADVVVLERGAVGQGTSLGNTGWICPSFTHPLPGPGIVRQGLRSLVQADGPLAVRPGLDPTYLRWLWLFRKSASRSRWQAGMRAFIELNRWTLDALDAYRRAGVRFEMHSAGMLLAALGREKLDGYLDLFRQIAALGFPGALTELSGDEAREHEPVLSDRVIGGVVTEVDRWVDPLSLTEGLAAWLREHGHTVREDVQVTSVRGRAGGATVDCDGEELAVDAVVVAAGISSPALLRSLGVRVPLAPARGYSLTYPRDGAVAPTRALYLADALVGSSTYADRVRLAGVFELGQTELTLRRRRLAAMLRTVDPFFADWRPSLAAPLEEWAGLRPVSADGLPLIGRTPAHERVFVATGHGMLGVTLAPATGALLAPLVLDGRSHPALAPFDPGRRI